MVLDSKALPLTRTWCLLEVLQTYRMKSDNSANARFQGLLFCTSDGVIGQSAKGCMDVSMALAERLVDLSVKDAQASRPEDHDKIMTLVEAEGGVERIDDFIRSSLRATLTQVQTRFADEMQAVLGRLGGTSSTVAVEQTAPSPGQPNLPMLLSSRSTIPVDEAQSKRQGGPADVFSL